MDTYQHATQFLAGLDSDWARLVDVVGACTHLPRPQYEPYEALLRTVAYQQLHARAAEAILGRLISLYQQTLPRPHQLLATPDEQLRGCGFSVRKIHTLKAIAAAADNGLVPSRAVAKTMAKEELIQHLITLPGIGRWTVEMLLIYTLEHMDILPADDFGVRNGYRLMKSLAEMPKRKTMQQVAALCSPYGTIAAWYLWRAAESQSRTK